MGVKWRWMGEWRAGIDTHIAPNIAPIFVLYCYFNFDPSFAICFDPHFNIPFPLIFTLISPPILQQNFAFILPAICPLHEFTPICPLHEFYLQQR